MWRALLPAAALVAALAALPTAAACCHGPILDQEVGPCTVDVWSDMIAGPYAKHARATCSAGGTTVGVEWVPCEPEFGAGWFTCLLP